MTLDKLGREVSEGDLVVYAGRLLKGRALLRPLEVDRVSETREAMVRLSGTRAWRWSRDVAKVAP